MAKLTTRLAVLVAGLALCGTASAQSAAPITDREVVGDWRLVITPVQGQGRSVTFQARDGSERLDFQLGITSQPNGRLNCIFDGDPAECRIRRGGLRIAVPGDGFTMIYTLKNRSPGGFTGDVDLRVRRLPVGGIVGSVNMIRR